MPNPNLPVYRCDIDDQVDSNLQVEFIALVDKPAIEKDFLAFNQAKLNFAINEEKRIVTGPAMLADMLIYRNDPDGLGEYYTVFDAASILKIVQKFFKKGFVQNFNIMHDPEQTTGSGVTVFESYITDSEQGKTAPKGFEEAKNGSWFISAKVDDDAVWDKVKAGIVKGFSVEGIFKQLPLKAAPLSAEVILKQIQKLLQAAGTAN